MTPNAIVLSGCIFFKENLIHQVLWWQHWNAVKPLLRSIHLRARANKAEHKVGPMVREAKSQVGALPNVSSLFARVVAMSGSEDGMIAGAMSVQGQYRVIELIFQ